MRVHSFQRFPSGCVWRFSSGSACICANKITNDDLKKITHVPTGRRTKIVNFEKTIWPKTRCFVGFKLEVNVYVWWTSRRQSEETENAWREYSPDNLNVHYVFHGMSPPSPLFFLTRWLYTSTYYGYSKACPIEWRQIFLSRNYSSQISFSQITSIFQAAKRDEILNAIDTAADNTFVRIMAHATFYVKTYIIFLIILNFLHFFNAILFKFEFVCSTTNLRISH